MQTHIRAISLENFKVFEEKCDFQFAPITILTGTNSSGKSSLVKGFQLMHKLFSNGELVDIIDIEEVLAIIGDFSKIPNKYSNNDVVSFYIPIVLRGIPDVMQLKLGYKLLPSSLNKGRLTSLQILSNKKKETSLDDDCIFSVNEEEFLKYEIRIDYNFFKQEYIREAREIKAYKETDDNELAKSIHPFYDNFIKANSPYFDKKYYRPFFDKYPGFFNSEHYTLLINYNYSNESNTASLLFNHNLINVIHEKDIDESLKSLSSDELQLKSAEIEKEYFTKICYYVKAIHKKVSLYNGIQQIIRQFDSFIELFYPNDAFDENGDRTGGYSFGQSDTNETKYFTWNSNKYQLTYPIKGIYFEMESNQLFFQSNMQFPVLFVLENIKYSIAEALEQFSNCFFLGSYRNQVQRAYTLKDGGEFQRLIKKIKETEDSDPENKILKFINKYLTRFEIGHGYKIEKEAESQGFCVYIKVKGKDVLLADMGYGISQVLPLIFKIIAVALEDGNDKKLLIEEPESNLHPALQSKLAELFADAAEHFNIQFIIETHSEYFIRKLQVLTANTYAKKKDGKLPKLLVDDTVIYYFNHPDSVNENEEQVYKINIEKDGALTKNFGKGFFDESSKLNIALYQFSKANKN